MSPTTVLQQNTSQERIDQLKDYSKWLLAIGDGKEPSAVPNVDGIIEIPPQMVCSSKEELESTAYDNFLANYNDVGYLSGKAIMLSTNNIIQQCNFDMIDSLPGETVVSSSIDECVEQEVQSMYDTSFPNRINASGIPPHRLALKRGSCIILIQNLDVKRKHYNGTRYIIDELLPHIIKAKRLNGNG